MISYILYFEPFVLLYAFGLIISIAYLAWSKEAFIYSEQKT